MNKSCNEKCLKTNFNEGKDFFVNENSSPDQDKTTPEQLSDFLIQRFTKNIEAFNRHYPDIAKKFENYIPEKSMDFFCSKSGTPNMAFSDDGVPYYEKYCSLQFLKFQSNVLSKVLKDSSSEKKEFDDFDPKEFCKYQCSDMLTANINILNHYCEKDLYGQIHLRYMHKMSDVYRNRYMGNILSLQESKIVPLFLMIGVGLGYQLSELSKEIDIHNLVIIEPDPDVFFVSMHTFDWASFLEKYISKEKNIELIIEKNTHVIGNSLYKFLTQNAFYSLGAHVVYLSNESDRNKEIVDEIKNRFLLSSAGFGFFDDKLFGVSHASYLLTHKKHFVQKKELPEKFKNLPVFVVGSGPSLDQDLPFIRKFQDKAIIIACGTALDVLYHAGIHPDFFANTERLPEVKQALQVITDSSFFKKIVLLCADVCHPSVADMFEHTAIFSKADELFCDYLTTNLNQPKIQGIFRMNPFVGNMGLSGALALGFRNIYMFGLDCGKKVGVQSIHSELTTLYKNRGFTEEPDFYGTDNIIPANFGGNCESNRTFLMSALTMSISIKETQEEGECSFINCSDGALIKGAVPVHSDMLENDFLKLKDINKDLIINYIDEERVIDFDLTVNHIKGVIYPQIFEKLCDSVITIIKEKKDSLKECLLTIKEVNDFFNEIRSNNSLTFFLAMIESAVCAPLVLATSALFEDSNPKECLKTANNILLMLKDYLTEAKDMYRLLPDYVMGEHRKHYPDGKLGKDMPHCKAPNFPEEVNILRKEYDDPIKKFTKRYE
ncbi:6-hydroxymethylpterin diphosphokinase MptE-like protein [Succinivibrio dextrinosolvens]|uniref:motility associated factor glycosyltransferase family protein n=1 Tax=Succinivibrio dextrinosolvens TaxID=83771 RepID=UPI001923A2EF|nr:6-hydroxymethylpterin diphosphokinase MptE-like protein [Succinivibrio dextrinosolvens]